MARPASAKISLSRLFIPLFYTGGGRGWLTSWGKYVTFVHYRFMCAHGCCVTAWPVRILSFTSGEDRLRRCGAVALNPARRGITQRGCHHASRMARRGVQARRPSRSYARWSGGFRDYTDTPYQCQPPRPAPLFGESDQVIREDPAGAVVVRAWPGHRNIGRGSCRSALADGVERRSTAVVRGLSVHSRRRPSGSLRPVNRSPPPIRLLSRRRKASGERVGWAI